MVRKRVDVVDIVLNALVIILIVIICIAFCALGFTIHHDMKANYLFSYGKQSYYILEFHYDGDFIKAVDVYGREVTFPKNYTVITDFLKRGTGQ